jgi:predicted lipoprotein with Yx(FWY)xxD motif
MTARFHAACGLGLLALAALAGCGGSGSNSATAATGGNGSAASSGSTRMAAVNVANNPQLGRILVDSKGLTLYTFQKDSGMKSNCNGQCAKFWPPDVATGRPTAGSGVTASMLGTTKRADGSTEVTYAGHPLYTYEADTSPGQVTGNGINTFGAVWNAVQPSGAKAPMGGSSGGSSSGTAPSSSGSSSAPASGGYSY